MTRLILGALALTLAATGASAAPARKAAPSCPIDRIIYAQPGVKGVTAGFAKQKVRSSYASDLVFFVQSGSQRFWYEFSSPNGYGGTYIRPQIDPKDVKEGPDGETPDVSLKPADPEEGAAKEDDGADMMMFDAFDAKLDVMSSPPMTGKAAPAYFFARELGPLFHYNHMSGLYKLEKPVEINIALWRRVGCSPKAH